VDIQVPSNVELGILKINYI